MFITLITPLIILFSYVLFNDEIFNKFSFLITSTGYLAIVYLTIVLIIPIINFQNDSFNTKNIGVSAFYLSFLHLLLYIYDNNFELSFLFEDLVYRNYITSGYIAFILFLPMYLTSFSFFKNIFSNWRKIHKIIYLMWYVCTLSWPKNVFIGLGQAKRGPGPHIQKREHVKGQRYAKPFRPTTCKR